MEKINSKGIFILTIFLTGTMFIGFGDSYLIKAADTTILITFLLGMIIGIIPLLLILYIGKFTKDKNIFELLKTEFGVFGIILSFLILASILFLGIVSIWNCLNFTVSQFFSRTPYILVGTILYSVITIAACKGIEVISRCAFILFPIFLITAFFIWIGLIPHLELNNFLPIMNISTNRFINATLMFPTYSVFPIVLLLSVKKDDIDDPENYNKSVIWGYICGGISVFIFIFFILGCFGVELAQIYVYPEYSLFKKIDAFNFIQKVENIASITIFIAFFIYNSFGVYFIKNFLISLFNTKGKKRTHLIVFIFEIALCLSTIYIFAVHHSNILISKYPTFIMFFTIPFIIVIFLLTIKKKKLLKS